MPFEIHLQTASPSNIGAGSKVYSPTLARFGLRSAHSGECFDFIRKENEGECKMCETLQVVS